MAQVEANRPATRPETIRGYKAAVKAFRETMPEVRRPEDPSADRVSRFGRLFLSATGKRG